MLPPDSATLEKKGNKDTIDEQEAIEVEEIEKTKEDVKGRLLAERIHNTIMKRILPNLESSLTTSVSHPRTCTLLNVVCCTKCVLKPL